MRFFLHPLQNVLLVLMLTQCTAATSAHQFEDGYVERSMAIRIRDREGTIEYSIGLNDTTMALFQQQWPKDAELFVQVDQTKSTPAIGTNLAAGQLPADDLKLPKEGTLVNEIELIRTFAKVATPHLERGLRVSANDQSLALKLVSATPSVKHHATLQTIWRFQLPEDGTVRLSALDTNFLEYPGGIRYSFKTSGSSMTVESNVAPILIRSTRTALDRLTVTQRLGSPGIVARIQQFRR